MNADQTLQQAGVLIPARRMEPGLIPLLTALCQAGFGAVIVVNDGMNPGERQTLDAFVANCPVHALHHAVNLGKGRALKTGFNYVSSHSLGIRVLLTADADGQHAVEDIVRIALVALQQPGAVVLGCRSFGQEVPLRSRAGNQLTRLIFYLFSGRGVRDTQTGLRAFPLQILPLLLPLEGERYEYEMSVLAHLSRRPVPFVEVPIQTIYLDGNRSSCFDPVRDSMRIYFVLARFYASSLVSAALDLVVFSITFWITRNILVSVVTGRMSSLLNFALNRSLVFRSQNSIPTALGRYYILAAVLAAISYGAICELSTWLGWNMIAIKILVETALSLVSFSVQRTFVFTVPASIEA